METVDLDDIVCVLKNEKGLINNWENFLTNLQLKRIGKEETAKLKLEFEHSLDESAILKQILSRWVEEYGEKSTVKALGAVLKTLSLPNLKYKLETTCMPSAIIQVGAYTSHKRTPSAETLLRVVNWSKSGGKDDCHLNLPIILRLLTEIGNIPVAIISINGNPSSTKSALADQFLKYLKYGLNGDPNWIRKEIGNGFVSTAVEFENATGIQVWNEPFFIKSESKKVGVILMEVHHGMERNGDIELDLKTTALALLISSNSIFLQNEDSVDVVNWFKGFLQTNEPKIYKKRLYQTLTVLFNKVPTSSQQIPEVEGKQLMSKLFSACTKELPGSLHTYFDVVKSDIVSLQTFNSSQFRTTRNVVALIANHLRPENISSFGKQIFGNELTGNTLKRYVCLWAQLVTTFKAKFYPKTLIYQTEEIAALNFGEDLLQEYRNVMENFLYDSPTAAQARFEELHSETVEELQKKLMTMTVSESIKKDCRVQFDKSTYALKYNFLKKIANKPKLYKQKPLEILVYDKNLVLGRGSSETVVYKGTFGTREVAVKRLNGIHFDLDKAKDELDLLIHCDSHRNVVTCYHGEKRDDAFLIVLELCDGSLDDWLGRKILLDVEIDHIDILRQSTEGIAYLHNYGIIHRDIKPQNILVVYDTILKQVRVKISDFGISKRLPAHRSSATITSASGTEGWMAPEIIQSAHYKSPTSGNEDSTKTKMTRASDIFSLGCVFYYVLTEGIHPFGDPFRRQVDILDNKPSIREEEIDECHRGGLPLIRNMIAKEPDIRPKISYILSHPLLWDNKRIIEFLVDVSNFAMENGKDENIKTAIEALENRAKELMGIVEENTKGWLSRINTPHLLEYLTKTGQNKNKGKRVMELIRAIRNMRNHYGQLSVQAQTEVGNLFDEFARYWTEKFPHLVPYTWDAFQEFADRPEFGLKNYYILA